MSDTSVARRRRPPRRPRTITPLDTDEWSALERHVDLLMLAVDGLEETGRHSILDRHAHVVPLVWLAMDIRTNLQALAKKVETATIVLPPWPRVRRAKARPRRTPRRPRPSPPPAELRDPDRQ